MPLSSSVRLRSPLPKPGQIDCMAVNYMEDGTLPQKPPINGFHKSPNAVIGDGDTMVLPDVPATIFEGEAELGLVIGKRAAHVKAADAMPYIFGYINFIDGSARNLPPAGNTFYQTKSRETFAPMGPFLVTADEIADPQNLQIKLWVNGVLKQNFNSSDMAQPDSALRRIRQLDPSAGSRRRDRVRHQPSGAQCLHGWRQGRAGSRGAGPAALQCAGRSETHLVASDTQARAPQQEASRAHTRLAITGKYAQGAK